MGSVGRESGSCLDSRAACGRIGVVRAACGVRSEGRRLRGRSPSIEPSFPWSDAMEGLPRPTGGILRSVGKVLSGRPTWPSPIPVQQGALALGRIGAARCPDSGLHPGRAWPAFGPAPERAGKPRLTPRPLLSSPCANSARKWTRNRVLARNRLEIGLCPLGRFVRPGVFPIDTPSHDEFRARARFRVHFGREILHAAQTASMEAAYAACPDPRLRMTSAAIRHAVAKTPKAVKPPPGGGMQRDEGLGGFKR